MKLAITAQGKDPSASLDPRFGRSLYFAVYNEETGRCEFIDNNSINLSGGAGIQTAQFLVKLGVQTLITGRVGPKAEASLKAAGIKVYAADEQDQVQDIYKKYKDGRLERMF